MSILINKIERIAFYLLIFFLPWQTRIIFRSWGSGFNEWNSASFYLTDALLVAVIFLWLIGFFKSPLRSPLYAKGGSGGIFGKTEIALLVFLGISALSLASAQNFWLGVFREVKLVEFGLLFLYLKNNLFQFDNAPSSRFAGEAGQPPLNLRGGVGGVITRVLQILVASGLLQALIAIGQFVRQKSFGLSFLDESPLSPVISGVAKIVVNGEKLIRPYGLTPHPNVLAVFLLLAIFGALVLFTQKNKDYKWGVAVFYALAGAILTFAFFLTFSRSVIVSGLIAIFGWLIYLCFKKEEFMQSSFVILSETKDLSRMRATVARIRWRFLGLRPRNDNKTQKSWVSRRWYFLNTIIIFGVCCLLVTVSLWSFLSARFDVGSGLTDQSLNLRVFYNQVALNLIGKSPILGVGVGNFVWTFQNSYHLAESWMYQPVHNIYLLIGAESGILGLLAFLVFLFFILKNIWRFRRDFIISCFLSLVTCFLVLGLFDHLLWDLQQGQLMLWIVLGVLASFIASPYGSTDRAQPSEG